MSTYCDQTADASATPVEPEHLGMVAFTLPKPDELPAAADRQPKQLLVRDCPTFSLSRLQVGVDEFLKMMLIAVSRRRSSTTEGSELAMACMQYEVAMSRFVPPAVHKEGVIHANEAELIVFFCQLQKKFGAYRGEKPLLVWLVAPEGTELDEAYKGLAPQGAVAYPLLAHFVGPFATKQHARAVLFSVVEPNVCPGHPHYPTQRGAIAMLSSNTFSEATIRAAVVEHAKRVNARLTARLEVTPECFELGTLTITTEVIASVHAEWTERAGCKPAVKECADYLEHLAQTYWSERLGAPGGKDIPTSCYWIPVNKPVYPSRYRHNGVEPENAMAPVHFMIVTGECVGNPIVADEPILPLLEPVKP
jgi:hypothetical protein